MKTPTVTIVISALNEEGSIKELISSLLRQKQIGYQLEHIIVSSDGSVDNTVEQILSINSRIVTVNEYKRRKGKAYRLSQMYMKCSSDLIVQLDADITLEGIDFVSKLVKPFTDSAIGMTGANSTPHKPTSFIGRAIESSTRPYIVLRRYSPSLSIGPVLAFRSELAKKVRFPRNIIGEDIFLYFFCLTIGFKYKYVESAVVRYVLPQTINDHIAQNSRFITSPILMHKYFPKDLIDREDYIPRYHFIKEMMKEAILHPILVLSIFLINSFCRLRAKFSHGTITGNWIVSDTTKKKN